MLGRCWGCRRKVLKMCQDVLDSVGDVEERRRVACVWGVGVGISYSLYTVQQYEPVTMLKLDQGSS